jgi:hypothetical protein
MPTFRTTLLLIGNNVGIEVPEDVVLGFGAGKRVPVKVTLNGFEYDSTVGVMGGKYLIPVSAAIRKSAGVAGGEQHDVTLEHAPGERSVEVPAELAAALESAGVRAAFDALSYSARKEHARSVSEAKAEATRERRIQKVLDSLS